MKQLIFGWVLLLVLNVSCRQLPLNETNGKNFLLNVKNLNNCHQTILKMVFNLKVGGHF